jgi:hypothetical protein
LVSNKIHIFAAQNHWIACLAHSIHASCGDRIITWQREDRKVAEVRELDGIHFKKKLGDEW